MKFNSACCTFSILLLTCFFVFQETDFVCFDTGFSGFESYDVDSLLASSPEVKENEGKSAKNEEVEETLPLTEETTDSETQAEHLENFEDVVPGNRSASVNQSHLDAKLALQSSSEIESESIVTPDVKERPEQETKDAQKNSVQTAPSRVLSEGNETKDIPEELVEETLTDMNVPSEIEPESELDILENEAVILDNITDVVEEALASSSEDAQIPDLETTLGTTFDAVATDDEITKSVTPYEEEGESEYLEDPPEEEDHDIVGTPLVAFSEEAVSAESDNKQEDAEEKNMWTSLGDAVFSVVTGGERMASDSLEDDNEDDDDDEEEEKYAPSIKQKRSYDAGSNVDNPAPQEVEEESGPTEPVIQEPLFKSLPEDDDKEEDTKSETLSFDSDDGTHKQVIGDVEAPEEMVKSTETSTSSVPSPSFHHDLVSSSDSSIDKAATQDSGARIENREHLDSDFGEDQVVDNQELASSGTHMKQSTENMHLEKFKDKVEEITMERIPDQVLDSLTDFDRNTSEPEFPVEEPVTEVELPQEEAEDEKDAHIEQEETEILLEDENAISLMQSNDTDPEEPRLEMASTTMSPSEPLYSDSVLRLTLLRDHFSEERMEQIQKLLGLKNLFKVEAMFSDLEVELQATRRLHTGAEQDVESILEGILEASENTILDEIEKMLDSQGAKHNHKQQLDASSLDMETDILDNFQELAFSLHQKYSTARDSAPLTTEEETDIDSGGFGL